MANLAEQLRQEKEGYKLPEWLADDVAGEIRNFGSASYICDHHIRDVSKGWSFPMKYQEALEKWGRDNGFRVYYTHNSYGVRSINFSL